MKPVAVEADDEWSRATLAVIERAESFGLTLAPVGKEPYGWDLRYADSTLIVRGFMPVIEATLKNWKAG
jgi:hypothetical protein